MHLLTSYSAANGELFRDWFLPTCPEPDAVLALRLEDGGGGGEYGSAGWQAGVSGKVAHVAEYLEELPDGGVFALADADIQFFPGFSLVALEGQLAASGCDILYQREFAPGGPPDVNTGFYVARATPVFREYFAEVRRRLAAAERKSDQTIVNALLPEAGLRWGHLPTRYYARTQGFPPPRDAVLHHANGTKHNSLQSKIAQLRRVRRYLTGGIAGRWLALAEEAAALAGSGGTLRALRRRLAPGKK